MLRYTDNSEIVQAVRKVEDLMFELGLQLEIVHHGIAFTFKDQQALYLDIEGTEETQFPGMFQTKLIDYDSYMDS